MNYYIEKHDMEMILDALELLSEHIKNKGGFYVWPVQDVDNLFQSFNDSLADS
jgi:hypothetical protein